MEIMQEYSILGVGYLLQTLPVTVAALAGIVVAAITWKKHSTVSLLIIIASALVLLDMSVGHYIQMSYILSRPSHFYEGSEDLAREFWESVLVFVRYLNSAIPMALFITAALIGRKSSR